MYKWTKSNTYAQRLSGKDGEKIGLARSISVMPRDKVNIEVYAKYYDPTASNEATFANLMSAIINNIGVPTGTFVDGSAYGLSTNLPFTPGWAAKDGTGAPPMAYLNWMVFDRNYLQDLSRSGYMRITTNAKETGTNATHDKLFSPEITITQPGYVYIWLSNENPTPVEVYFDDFKVTQTKSPVISSSDYYPFGAVSQSYSRENSVPNKRLYQGKEYQDDLSLNLYDFHWRQYDPWSVQTTAMDPKAEKFYRLSPYSWAAGNPMKFIDPDGREIILSVKNKSAWNSYRDVVNTGFEGQFALSYTKQKGGGFKLSISATKNGGNLNALSKEGQAFYKRMSQIINDPKNTVNMTLVENSRNVNIGRYGTGELDIADVKKFNSGGKGTDYSQPTGATQQGKLIHETVEQYEKAKLNLPHDGTNNGHLATHNPAITAENEVNGNTRLASKEKYISGWYTTPYLEKDGSTTMTSYSLGSNSMEVNQPKPMPLIREIDEK